MKSISEFSKRKQIQKKISAITCYDYVFARIIDQTSIDFVIVGDSSSMVMHGATNPTKATLTHMLMHTAWVAKGIKNKLIISDLPFLSYRKSLANTMEAVESLIRAGAQAIKLEGVRGNEHTIQHIVESGVPVMGHIGLMPQHFHHSGFSVQGEHPMDSQRLLDEAKQLEVLGCFAIVLECIPGKLAATITQSLHIPTIGIGAGAHTDGQVLVLHDLLGFYTASKPPRFLKTYLNGSELCRQSIEQYVQEVNGSLFPDIEHTYSDYHL